MGFMQSFHRGDNDMSSEHKHSHGEILKKICQLKILYEYNE